MKVHTDARATAAPQPAAPVAAVPAVLAVILVGLLAGMTLSGCGGPSQAGATSTDAAEPTAATWTWPAGSATFALGGGRQPMRKGHLDEAGTLVDQRGTRHRLDPTTRRQLERWLRAPDALGRQAADLNCSAGSDEEYVMVGFAATTALSQPFTFCTAGLGRLPGGDELRRVVEILRAT